MNCPTNDFQISRLLDGEIGAWERIALEEHLSDCAQCRETKKSWELQKALLRSFLARHSLDESFVNKVRRARQSHDLITSAAQRGWLRKDLFVWLQAAAVALIVILVFTYLFPAVDNLALARVLNAGDRLEVRSPSSSAWMPAGPGATLRSGDWVRNPENDIAQLLLRDSSRINLERGATAQLLGNSENLRNELLLIGGTIVSLGGGDAPGLQVHTPAGDIAGREGEFAVWVREMTLPRLERSPDGFESVKGYVEVIAGVNALRGHVQIASAAGRQDVAPGNSALFTSSRLMVANASIATIGNVEASLQPTAPDPSGSGSLVSRLIASEHDIRLQLEVDRLPLSRLLALTTDQRVEGGEKIQVSGKVAYTPDPSLENLVGAIGTSLGMEITLRRETARKEIVSSFVTTADPGVEKEGREFFVRRYATGLLTFRFQAIPARDVFRFLRSESGDLPQLAPETEMAPLSLSAESMKPSDVRAWLQQQLRWQVQESEEVVQVVEVNNSSYTTGDQPGRKVVEDFGNTTRDIPEPAHQSQAVYQAARGSDRIPEPSLIRRSTTFGARPFSRPNVTPPEVLILASSTSGSAAAVAKASQSAKGTVTVLSAKTGGSGLNVTVKVSRKSGQAGDEVFPEADPLEVSSHFVWPAIRSSETAGTGESYSLFNPSLQSAHTKWDGFDSRGGLLVTFELEIVGNSSAVLFPERISGGLEEGGHWETHTDIPLSSSVVDPSGMVAMGTGVDPARLPSFWEFETASISGTGGGSSLWLINPGDITARVLLAIVEDDRAIITQEILLDPHAGMIWSAESLLPAYLEITRLHPGSRVILQATNGSVIAGLSGGNQVPRNPRIQGKRERVLDATFGH